MAAPALVHKDIPKTNGHSKNLLTDPQPALEIDALIVGAGFGGVWQLKKLREKGLNVKLVELGSDYGGVWYWNRYPGARVDSTIPHYEFSDKNLWQDWNWKQRFPGSAELRGYFAHVADKWDLRKDTIFDTFVDSAAWDKIEQRWVIGTNTGMRFKAQFFLPNTGFAAKRHTPDWKGMDSFKGTWVHPSYWPHEEPDVKGKRVAVIGTGSTGVQLVQELAPIAKELVLFQRTPNLSLPMGQMEYKGSEQRFSRDKYAAFFPARNDSFGGFDFNFLPKATFDDDPEQRKATYEELWAQGDFHFWLATYWDMLFNDEANTEAYNFWRDKIRARINDPRLREKLAPRIKPHPFGCKRVSLENGYYELFNKPNVHLVDVNETPVEEVTERGIRTTEKDWEFDYVVCATGFDAITGGLLQMNIRGEDGQTLTEKWKQGGLATFLGMSVSGFPNMFFTYGPQAPTAFCNGPTCAELQGDWIVKAIMHMREQKLESINATKQSEKDWAENIWKMANGTLLPAAKSWYMGDNILGKTREPLVYLGGVPSYYKSINECAVGGYQGFAFA